MLLQFPILATLFGWFAEPDVKPGFKLDSTGHVNRTLPGGRRYLLHVPERYNDAVAHPVVLSFHGAQGTSERQERISQLSLPDQEINGLPIIAAYPQGSPNTKWNWTAIWTGAPYYNRTVDDVKFVHDILHDIHSAYNIDRFRIYASGKSNGGGFTNYLACHPVLSSVFAAFSTVSPALYAEAGGFGTCHPSRQIPLLAFHGELDRDTLYWGRNESIGRGMHELPVVPQWRREWAERNGCDEAQVNSPLVKDGVAGTRIEEWPCGITALTDPSLGHAWPSTLGLDDAGRPDQYAGFNYTEEYLTSFFSKHVLDKYDYSFWQ